MSSTTMSYAIDDKELDDAALWAVIDSAEASYSSSKSRTNTKPLLKYKTPTPSPSQNPRKLQFSPSPYSRPHKIPKHEPATPLAVSFSSPEAYLSPQIRVEVDENNKDSVRHCLNAKFPSVSLFKDYQNAAMAILEKTDYTMISGSPFIKKSGWRKISFYFNLSFEIKDKNIEFDENRNVQRAEFIVRAYMQNGRFSDGWGSCERREKRFQKPNHDIPSTAETRAKNRASQDLLGIGEYQPGASQYRQ